MRGAPPCRNSSEEGALRKTHSEKRVISARHASSHCRRRKIARTSSYAEKPNLLEFWRLRPLRRRVRAWCGVEILPVKRGSLHLLRKPSPFGGSPISPAPHHGPRLPQPFYNSPLSLRTKARKLLKISGLSSLTSLISLVPPSLAVGVVPLDAQFVLVHGARRNRSQPQKPVRQSE